MAAARGKTRPDQGGRCVEVVSGRWTPVAVALGAVALAGCAQLPGPDPGALPDASMEPVAGADPRAAEASDAALSAYAGYLSAARKASRVPDPHHPALRTYLADPLLTRVRLDIREMKRHGAVRTGSLTSNPRVTEVNLGAVPATVMIQDCIDSTGYRMIYVKDSAPVPGAEGGRYVATATASRYPDGRWLINDGAAHVDQPC